MGIGKEELTIAVGGEEGEKGSWRKEEAMGTEMKEVLPHSRARMQSVFAEAFGTRMVLLMAVEEEGVYMSCRQICVRLWSGGGGSNSDGEWGKKRKRTGKLDSLLSPLPLHRRKSEKKENSLLTFVGFPFHLSSSDLSCVQIYKDLSSFQTAGPNQPSLLILFHLLETRRGKEKKG